MQSVGCVRVLHSIRSFIHCKLQLHTDVQLQENNKKKETLKMFIVQLSDVKDTVAVSPKPMQKGGWVCLVFYLQIHTKQCGKKKITVERLKHMYSYIFTRIRLNNFNIST